MIISDVRIRLITNLGKVKAAASITIDEVFVVHDIKIVDGANGLYISMPSRRAKNGEFKDIAHPIYREVRTDLQDTIIEAYKKKLEELETE